MFLVGAAGIVRGQFLSQLKARSFPLGELRVFLRPRYKMLLSILLRNLCRQYRILHGLKRRLSGRNVLVYEPVWIRLNAI